MADVKISQLPAATTPLAGTEEVPLVQSGVTKKVSVTNLRGAASVTAVTGVAPVVSSGGATPAISMPAATTSADGYLTSTDWNTFNNKQPAGSYLTNGGALGTPSSGTATNLTGLPLTTGVTGLLPVANGGTGTATPSLVAGTNVSITGTWPNQTINSSGGGGGGMVYPGAGIPLSTGTAWDTSYSTTGTGTVVALATSPTLATPAITGGTINNATIGATTASTGVFTSLTVNDNTTFGSSNTDTATFNARVASEFTPSAANTYDLGRNSHEWRNLYLTGTANITTLSVSGIATLGTGAVLGTPASATLTNATGLPLTTGVTGLLPVANGGTGTATPALVAGTNVSITGSWPNQTINATAGGSGTVTSVDATVPAFLSVSGGPITTSGTLAIAYSGTALPIANGGTGTTSTTFVNLTTNVTGTLPIANGGTGATSLAAAGIVTLAGTETLTNKTISGANNTLTVDGTNEVGFRIIPQNSQSAAYTLVLDDSGKHIFHPAADNNARTFTIPANSSVAFPIGTAVTFINMAVANVTIAITTDTLTLSPAGTTGSRTLARYGSATAVKITATEWLISGSGLT